MAMSTDLDRTRKWYERQVQPQPDGTFLFRPFGYHGGVYELPDASAKNLYVSTQSNLLESVNTGRGVLVMLVISLLVFVFSLLATTLSTMFSSWNAGNIIFWAALGLGLLWVLRFPWSARRMLRRVGAKRVPRQRWQGPAIRDPFGLYARPWLLALAFTQLVCFLTFVPSAWRVVAAGRLPRAEDAVLAAGAVVMLVMSLLYFRAFYRRTRKATPENDSGPG
jgi:hypothetical protein